MDPTLLQKDYARALELHEQGRSDEAVTLYKKILEHLPDADLVLYNMGLALYNGARWRDAAAAFSRAAELRPEDPDYWYNAGLALKHCCCYEEAFEAYEKALSLHPEDSDILYNMGCCLQDAGDRARAMEFYQQVLELTDDPSALSNLAYCTHLDGDYRRAAELYERLLQLNPNHLAARHMLQALKGKNTDNPPPGYISRLFDNYSESFDRDLLENLSYRVPALLHALLERHLGPGKKELFVIDLGCGTGLSGMVVREYADKLAGVDLSAGMIGEARKKGCYDHLRVGDVVEFLKELDNPADLVLAADVLTYLGNLEALFTTAAAKTRPGGWFCFSTEQGESPRWELRLTGRYGHHPEYIAQLAGSTGWQVVGMETAGIRKERGRWITGNLYLLARLS